MNKTVMRCIVICAVAVWIILSLAVPWVLADTNAFLKGFVNPKLLSLLGVIVTITLASAANLHIELNKIEEAAGKSAFVNTRVSINARPVAHRLIDRRRAGRPYQAVGRTRPGRAPNRGIAVERRRPSDHPRTHRLDSSCRARAFAIPSNLNDQREPFERQAMVPTWYA